MFDTLRKEIRGLDKQSMEKAKERWDNIAKPLASLGKLETCIIQIAGIQCTDYVELSKPVVCVMCADNGVVANGVTQVDSTVTAIVAENMTKEKSIVTIMAKTIQAEICVVDIGMNTSLNGAGLRNEKVMFGTNDMTIESAMTKAQAIKAINVGIRMAKKFKKDGYHCILTGEMGIGNTTTSAAIASVLLEKSIEEVTGRGAGLCTSGLARKINAIDKAIERNMPQKEDVLDVLSKVGGLDIAGMVGLYIGGAIVQMPVIIDGFISGVAALIAKLLIPECSDYMIPSHCSAEPAGALILNELKLSPLVTCDMCLGEGTGAVAAVSLIQLGLRVYNEMSNFEEARIEKYKHLN